MKHRTFTTIELLIAIAIILILAAMVLWGTRHASIRAKEADTIAIMEEFTTALEAFYDDNGFYPQPFESTDYSIVDFDDTSWDLFTNREKNPKNRPYMEGNLNGTLKDGFGNSFLYQYPGENNKTKFDLWSLGHDRKDAADDITNWQRH